MRIRKEAGQGLILALILLAIGSVVVIPALTLTSTSLKNSQLVGGRERSLYAVDAAQEFVMWKLLHTSFITDANLSYDRATANFTVDVCGTPVSVSVVMRAIATWRGVTLIGNTPIKPTKTASPNSVNAGISQTYTFTIELEQISDNTDQGLDAVYDVLPDGFLLGDYIGGSSELSTDGGTTWQPIDDPLLENSQTWPTPGPSFGNRVRLRWPNPLTYGQDNFASPMRDFAGGQVKKIRYRITSNLPNSSKRYYYYFSWVVLKPWNTLSGTTGTIIVNNTGKTGTAYQGGLIDTSKTAQPSFIAPGQLTDVTYTITVKDQTGAANNKIDTITDYLPPGFSFVGLTSPYDLIPTSNTTTFGYVNGVYRQTANFTFSPTVGFDANNQRKLTFIARTSENVSGSYYNEVNVSTNVGIPTILSTPGISATKPDFNTGYTWNSAPVIVPAYDSSATSGNVTVTTEANLGVTVGGMDIISYQIE
ncbi:MAG: hypothetical protein A2Z28_06280 [Chloroflexi bacterium RBG_16_51_9]|nr:MAG: hypothetical protein A2Z28_06280 [Chloroflexi bacterium RBG_16_51_9]